MNQLKQSLGEQSELLSVLHKFAESIYTNPLNLLLLGLILYILLPLVSPSSPLSSRWTPSLAEARSHLAAPSDRYTYLPPHHPDVIERTKYTPRTLAVYDGTGTTQDGERILLAINRKVFDVTKGKNFYGPGGPYGNFAGRDASRGMAKQSFDLDMLTPLDRPIDALEDLTPSEVKNMKEWQAHFTGKYGIVGELIDENEA
ncbi:Cytochrome b5-like heme/steroid binding domain protein [Kalmanozyma brasiliensis GHG001]|uniref:Cytochrome b5 heme-binding domain-containing protein n=1 Tax=Kalmanozyma brasiliensis (strain GHG001) TaxID=1365824 RepID=V5EBZ1_KALBG|nr:Cytochrome b5-like heme/steroid binding domain protein [Kalmanozyma brasiliensis GHG001]EST07956.1 Cytochrome b5-like heme/steroid binding domain protein [Kalmanozyma brasiliensis GHG001]